MATRGPFDLVFESRTSLAPSTDEFVFRRADGVPVQFRPGQFAMFHFIEEGEKLDRSYSFAAAPEGTARAVFAITLLDDGRSAKHLRALQPGDVVRASGPHGRFVLRDEAIRRYVLVATGTGIGPYRAMLPGLAERMSATELQVHLVFGCRSPSDLLYAAELDAFAAAHPGFTWEARLSRDVGADPPSHHRPGRVLAAFDALGLEPGEDVVYLCGNPDMIDSASARLVELGYPPFSIRREKYVSA